MAHLDTHRAQARSLLKRGLITQKAHDGMLAKMEALAPVIAGQPSGSDAGAAQMPPVAPISATVSVPPGQGNLADPETRTA